MNFEEGEMLLIDKPYSVTSFGIVAQLKKWTKAKIGHAGTLDPLASGLMILCTGRWTKKLTELTGMDKEYTGIIHLGATTPSYDLETLPENFQDISHITEAEIIAATENFKGLITQFPPIHSALKVDGKPMYKLARKGVEVEMKSRQVMIHAFDITKIDGPEVHFRIHCNSGTYIRSMAFDFGQVLGCGGYLQQLCRTKIGPYALEDAWDLDSMRAHFGSAMNLKQILPRTAEC